VAENDEELHAFSFAGDDGCFMVIDLWCLLTIKTSKIARNVSSKMGVPEQEH